MMIDLHAHILPGLDDGAVTMEETVEMAQISAESGVRLMAATPHSNQSGRFENFFSKGFIRAFLNVQKAIDEYKIPLKLYPGMEIYASEDVAEKIKSGKLIGINRSKYYLIEFPFWATPEYIEKILRLVLASGKIPIIAHPERYGCIQRTPAQIYKWLHLGCLTQINKDSVFGYFGSMAEQAAKYLIETEMVSIVASDAHEAERRTPWMADIREWLEIYCGVGYAETLLYKNPRLILENKPVPFYSER